MNARIITIILYLLISGCRNVNSLDQLPVRTAQVVEGQSVQIYLNEGVVTVRGNTDGQVYVNGQTLSSDQTNYNITKVNDQVQITVNYKGKRSSSPPVYLEVSVPNDIALTIETDSASITVREYSGEVKADSVSGNIFIEDVQGSITMHSNRGDVRIGGSTGKISVVGNYGLLTLENAQGEIGVSTIMGNVVFNGAILTGDEVYLETDHGAVSAQLSADSALSIQVRSTSGDVACMVPGLTSTTRICDGIMNSGGGSLSIRTVSGAVMLQLLP